MSDTKFTKLADIFITRSGRYYYIEGLLLDESESESKRFEHRSVKYSTFKQKLDSLLQEYELV